MTTKSILLAIADPQALVDITQTLGAEWDTVSVASDTDALAQLEKRTFDALLVDFNLVDPDASELLNQALEKHPQTIGFLLAYEADLALVAAKVLGSPHLLPKPIEPASIKTRIENALRSSDSKQSENDATNATSASPTIPAVYAEVLKAIESPGVTDAQVGEIIAQDEALTCEVVTLTNSSYLGLPRNITDPVEAVQSLGLEAVKALVMALQFLAEHSRLKPGYLSLQEIWQHSVNVAQIARDLVLFETKDRTLASQALIAGLLHDLGKVVLATNFDDLYGRVHSLARKQPVSLWDIEKEMFGANHGEIGACLVGMWNMPAEVVEAAALHHEPPLGEHQQLTALASVHIANVLEHQLQPDRNEMMVAPIVNTAFLDELGLLQRLPVWRAAFANRRSENVEPEVESAEIDPSIEFVAGASVPRTANELSPPAAATRTTTSGQPQSGEATPTVRATGHRRQWLYAGVAAVLVLLALWIKTQPDLDPAEPVYARTPAQHDTPAAVSTSSSEAVLAAAPEATPAVDVSEESPAASAASETAANPAAASAPEPSPVPALKETAINVPPPEVAAPAVKAAPDFRLNGIIYTSVRPSAIVNGRTVRVGDQVNGATVVRISQTAVTLQINGQHKIYELQ